MLYQLEAAIFMFGVLTTIILAIILLAIGVYVTRWYARKKEWDDSSSTAFIVNIIWLISGIPISALFTFMFGVGFLIDLFELVIAIIIGTIVVKYVYKKEFGESFVFVIVIQIILFLIGLLIGVILGAIFAVILLGLLL
ncbi:MAG: hypothetical protein ACTSO6_08620 [Promethearchaeota archaeon]